MVIDPPFKCTQPVQDEGRENIMKGEYPRSLEGRQGGCRVQVSVVFNSNVKEQISSLVLPPPQDPSPDESWFAVCISPTLDKDKRVFLVRFTAHFQGQRNSSWLSLQTLGRTNPLSLPPSHPHTPPHRPVSIRK